jgi:hypothetical protein
VDVGEMQTKLSRWAEQDRSRRFDDLYNLLYDDNWLGTAQAHIKQNAGSRTAGCEGVVMGSFEENLEENLKKLAEDLKVGRFEPQPVRRTYIREVKAGGRVKMRPLGIPAIRDRIVQEALRMVLEPIWEADFSRHSYGFRPDRSTRDAVAYISARTRSSSSQRYGWIIEGDIQCCGLIKTDTSERVIRWATEVSPDGRATPDLSRSIDACSRPPRDGPGRWGCRRGTECREQGHEARALETRPCGTRGRGLPRARSSVARAGGAPPPGCGTSASTNGA